MFTSRLFSRTRIDSIVKSQMLALMDALEERSDGCCYTKSSDFSTQGFRNSLTHQFSGLQADIRTEGSYDFGMNGSSAGYGVLKIDIKLFDLAALLDTHFGTPEFRGCVLRKKGIRPLVQEDMIALMDALEERSDGCCYTKSSDFSTQGFRNSLTHQFPRLQADIRTEGSYDFGMSGSSAGSAGYRVLKIDMTLACLAEYLDQYQFDGALCVEAIRIEF